MHAMHLNHLQRQLTRKILLVSVVSRDKKLHYNSQKPFQRIIIFSTKNPTPAKPKQQHKQQVKQVYTSGTLVYYFYSKYRNQKSLLPKKIKQHARSIQVDLTCGWWGTIWHTTRHKMTEKDQQLVFLRIVLSDGGTTAKSPNKLVQRCGAGVSFIKKVTTTIKKTFSCAESPLLSFYFPMQYACLL